MRAHTRCGILYAGSRGCGQPRAFSIRSKKQRSKQNAGRICPRNSSIHPPSRPPELLSQVWSAVVSLIRAHEPVNLVVVQDLFEDACEVTPGPVLDEFTIRQVEAAAGAMTGAVWFVVRERGAGPKATAAETSAAHKACQVGRAGGPGSRCWLGAGCLQGELRATSTQLLNV